MTKEQMIVAIVVAIIGVIGTSIGSVFAYLQFAVKRKDEKEEKDVIKLITIQVEEAKKEMQEKLDAVSVARSLEGKDRFDTHAAAIKEINDQIRANSKQIGELTALTKTQMGKMDVFTESISSLNKVIEVSAESQRNSNYDRILMVANKALKNNKITITEKTNLTQLYESYGKLGGIDPKIRTLYVECEKLPTVPDEGV